MVVDSTAGGRFRSAQSRQQNVDGSLGARARTESPPLGGQVPGLRVVRVADLLAPDWICEVLSPSTADFDRDEKMPLYAREGVRHAWLVDPIARTLEVFVLGAEGRWVPAGVHRDDARVRAEPFDAIELDLRVLWAK